MPRQTKRQPTAVLLNMTEYARHRGCDEKTVRQALAEGRIKRVGTDRRCIDPVAADAEWTRNTGPKGGPGGFRPRRDGKTTATTGGSSAAPPAAPDSAPVAGTSFAEERALKERALRKLAELEASRAAGASIEREPALRAVYTAFRELRDSLTLIGRRVAPKVAALTDVHHIRREYEAELRSALEDFSKRRLPALAKTLGGKAEDHAGAQGEA